LGRLRLHDGTAAIALGSTGQLAGLARVSFEAVTGEFNADVKRAEATYRDATRGMSDDAIRLELSQERLRRELAKGPANFRGIARAELEVRRSEQALRGENQRLERQFHETGRAADRMGRGMLAGSGALRGLGRNLAFASAGFLGGTGLVYGMRSAISAASNLEEQQNKTRVVFEDSAQEVLDWSRTTATSIGIASDQALGYAGQIGAILNVTGLARAESAGMSREIVQLAADMASFNNEDPTEMLEAIRSGLVGEAEPLRRRGVLLDEATVKGEAYRLGLAKQGEELSQGEKVQARYSLILKQTTDQQGDYARTSDSLANSQRTLSALWREANILVGQALAPAFTDAVQATRDWLAEERNQEQLQRTVNALVSDAEKIVRGFAGGLRVAKDAVEPLVGAVGGLENAIRILTVTWLAMKAKAVLGFLGIAAASRVTSTKMVADAAVAGRAWDVATRPRTMVVTTVGGGPVGTGGRLARGLGYLGLTPATAVLLGAGTAAYFGIRSGQAGGISDSEYEKLKRAVRAGKVPPGDFEKLMALPDDVLSDERKRELQGIRAARDADRNRGERPEEGVAHRQAAEAQRRARERARQRRGSPLTLARVETQVAAIEEQRLDVAPGSAADVRLQREELALIRRALRELELTRDQRVALKQRRNALQAELDRIAEDERTEAQQRADKQKQDRQERQQRERDERAERVRTRIGQRERKLTIAEELAEETERNLMDDKKALIALRRFYGQQAQNDKLTLAERQAFADKRRAVRRRLRELYSVAVDEAIEDDKITERERKRLAALGGSDLVRRARRELAQKDGKGKGKGEGELTADELRSMLFEFTTGLHGVIGQYAGNVGESAADFGLVATHAQIQTLELREQTKILSEFTGGVRHPMTGYHKTEGTALLHGYGF
jgi:hypothetical protein